MDDIVKMFDEYAHLSTSKRVDGMSDSYKGTIRTYLAQLQQCDYEGLRNFLMARNDLAHSTKAIIARGVGRFLYMYKLLDRESFDMLKKMFKMPTNSWSTCELNDEVVHDIFLSSMKARTEMETYRNPVMIMLLSSLGLRVKQLVSIDADDIIDEDEYYSIKIVRQKEVRQGINKSYAVKKLSKRFSLCDYYFYILFKSYLDFRNEREPDSNALFISKYNERISTRQVQMTINGIATKLGHPDITPHSFRHYVGTKMVKEHGIVKTAVLLDHSDIKITQKYLQREDFNMIIGEEYEAI